MIKAFMFDTAASPYYTISSYLDFHYKPGKFYGFCDVALTADDVSNYSFVSNNVNILYEFTQKIPMTLRTVFLNCVATGVKVKDYILTPDAIVLYFDTNIRECFKKGETYKLYLDFHKALMVDELFNVWVDNKIILSLRQITK